MAGGARRSGADVRQTGVTRPDPTLLDAAAVASLLDADPAAGLSPEEAARRLATDGPNTLRERPPEPGWHRVVRQFQDPLVGLLLVAVVVSLVAWFVEGATGVPVDVVVIVAVLVLNAAIGLVQERRAERAVAALAAMTAATATVVRAGRLSTVPARDLVVGDLLALAEGDAVGADARLVVASGLTVQEASLTGESVATVKEVAALPAPTPIGERVNMVFKGTAVVRGVGRAVVTATGMATEVGRIATLLEEAEQEPTPLQREIARISRSLGIAVIAIAALAMALMVAVNGVRGPSDAVDVLLTGVSLAVAAVPEGLPAIMSVVLAIGVQAMARRHAVVKGLHAVEALGCASVICSDKTGTLTRNEMTLRLVVTASGRLQLSGTGYRPEGRATVLEGDEERVLAEAAHVLVGGAVANNAQLTRLADEWLIEGDPTEAAFLVAQHKLEGVSERVGGHSREAEVPFSSERSRMSVLGQDAAGRRRLLTKGAADVLLPHCSHRFVGPDVVEPFTGETRRAAQADVEELSRHGYRTLGVAYRDLEPGELRDPDAVGEEAESELVYCGVVALLDPPREEVRGAVEEARRAGVRTLMITGDHPLAAAHIAGELGIAHGQRPPRVLTGVELAGLTADGFQRATREVSVYARVSPEQKLRIVDALQRDGEVVAMTGDGVNDAPALKSADIGVAMGRTGTEVTKEAARMILADDNYATIVAAIRHGRVIVDDIRKVLRYLLGSNIGEVVTVFVGVLLARWLGLVDPADPTVTVVPLLATQILWINLVTDSAPALALGVDPQTEDVMGRPPRARDDRVVDRAMWRRVLRSGLVMGAASLVAFDLCLPGGLLLGLDGQAAPDQALEVARTTAFTTLVLAQLFNVFAARSDAVSAIRHLGVNRWLWGAVALGVALQVAVVELPALQVAFGTHALDGVHWLAAVGLASAVLWVDELARLVRFRRRGA